MFQDKFDDLNAYRYKNELCSFNKHTKAKKGNYGEAIYI